MGDAGYFDPPEGLIEQAEAASGVALAIGQDPRALVHLVLDVRRNHARTDDTGYTARLACHPDLATELGRNLIAAAKAARVDLARWRAGERPARG